MSPFGTVLIANRGEIALRIARTCREMGIRTVAVYSSADRDGLVARYADEAVHIGPAPARRSYLYVPNIIEAARRTGADAVHPGYGFLSEDPDFAQICADNDLMFIGPRPEVMRTVGDKARVLTQMAAVGLPVLPGGEGVLPTLGEAEAVAAEIGYPVVVKAAAGGGGKGIAVADSRAELQDAYRTTTATARSLFGNGDVYLERYVPAARHVEVQLLCDQAGNVLHLGERDCSLQRRKQKLVEEAPSPGLRPDVREQIYEYAVTGARSLNYSGAGTMEFLVDPAGGVTFMEINGRIQVEHPVTEMLTGIDLVREQILVAAGEPLSLKQEDVRFDGVALECRVNAEDPAADFRPAPGRVDVFRTPGGPATRVDAAVGAGDAVQPYYDSLMAKLIVWAPHRDAAIARADRALAEFEIEGPGVSTTIPFLRELLAQPGFVRGEHTTRFVDQLTAGATPTEWAV